MFASPFHFAITIEVNGFPVRHPTAFVIDHSGTSSLACLQHTGRFLVGHLWCHSILTDRRRRSIRTSIASSFLFLFFSLDVEGTLHLKGEVGGFGKLKSPHYPLL